MASAFPPYRPVAAVSFDQPGVRFACDACGEIVLGEPAGHGGYLFDRGGERRREDAPLCEACALAITVTALTDLEIEEEG